MVEWLNANSGAVQAVATGVLVLVTFWYAALTRLIVRETRRAQRAYVYADLVSANVWAELLVGNDGVRAAHDVRLAVDSTDPDVEKQLRSLSAIGGGISYLAPGRHYRFGLGNSLAKWVRKDPPPSVRIELSYRDADHAYKDSFTIELRALADASYSSFEVPEDRIARSLGEIHAVMRSRESKESIALMKPFQHQCPECRRYISFDAKRCPECHAWLMPYVTRLRRSIRGLLARFASREKPE